MLSLFSIFIISFTFLSHLSKQSYLSSLFFSLFDYISYLQSIRLENTRLACFSSTWIILCNKKYIDTKNYVRRMTAFRFLFSIGAKRLIGLLLSRESRVKLLTHRATRTTVAAQCAVRCELITDYYCNARATHLRANQRQINYRRS